MYMKFNHYVDKLLLSLMLLHLYYGTVLPAKSDSYVMFCLQRYQGLIIDRSIVY